MVANGHDHAIEKKEKSSKIRRKRSKSQSKRKSSRKESTNDKSDNGDKIQLEIKDNWNSREFHDQGDTPDTWDETDELKGEEKAPSKQSK